MKEFETIALVIAKITNVTRDELVSKTRKRPIAELKMICSQLLKNCSYDASEKITVVKIGEMLNIGHSAVTYHLKQHPILLAGKDGKYKELYEKIFKGYKSNKSLPIINDLERRRAILIEQIKNEEKNLSKLILEKEEIDRKIDQLVFVSGFLGQNS